jgi:hypothetical protein
LKKKELTHKEAAYYSHLSPGGLANLNYRGKGPKRRKRGNRLYYLEDDLDVWNKTREKQFES